MQCFHRETDNAKLVNVVKNHYLKKNQQIVFDWHLKFFYDICFNSQINQGSVFSLNFNVFIRALKYSQIYLFEIWICSWDFESFLRFILLLKCLIKKWFLLILSVPQRNLLWHTKVCSVSHNETDNATSVNAVVSDWQKTENWYLRIYI